MATNRQRKRASKARGKPFVVAVLASGAQAAGKSQRKSLNPELRLRARKPPRQDDARNNLEQDHEVRGWSEKLGVSQKQLRSAVAKAGPMVTNAIDPRGENHAKTHY